MDFVANLILRRLRWAYWPREIYRYYTRASVLRAVPCPNFIPELTRGRDPDAYDAYNQGRVLFMYRVLMGGGTLDPIDVEVGRTCIVTMRVHVTDGHHRLMAHYFAKASTLRAVYSGPLEILDWLTGKQKNRPENLVTNHD